MQLAWVLLESSSSSSFKPQASLNNSLSKLSMSTRSRCSDCSSKQFLPLDSHGICTFCLQARLPSVPSSGYASHIREIAPRNKQYVPRIFQSYRHATTIDMLPENVLLEIFDFYRNNSDNTRLWNWHLLVHVCRRWRQIVFSSPVRLNLRILCTSRISVEESLSIWPTLPIDIEYSYSWGEIGPRGHDNVIAALKHPDRVCDVSLRIKGPQFKLGQVVTVMKEPFPVLTRLYIRSDDSNVPALPEDFLGRSAPRLREFTLSGIPYPALPALLPSASNLVTLGLDTFHLGRWLHVWPHCPGSTTLTFNSNRLLPLLNEYLLP
ncbi:hypothetical protein V8E53_011692 [Lactarius tabidus]